MLGPPSRSPGAHRDLTGMLSSVCSPAPASVSSPRARPVSGPCTPCPSNTANISQRLSESTGPEGSGHLRQPAFPAGTLHLHTEASGGDQPGGALHTDAAPVRTGPAPANLNAWWAGQALCPHRALNPAQVRSWRQKADPGRSSPGKRHRLEQTRAASHIPFPIGLFS